MQKIRVERHQKIINSNVRDGQNEIIGKFGNSYSEQVKFEGGNHKEEEEKE